MLTAVFDDIILISEAFILTEKIDKNDEPINETVAEDERDTVSEAVFEQISQAEMRAAKEAKKMKLRKILYPLAILAIILLWASSLFGSK